MTVLRVGVLAAVAIAQGLVFTGLAAAVDTATVQVVRGELVIQASGRTAHRISVVQGARTLEVSDVEPLFAGTGCNRVSPTQVSCPFGGITRMSVELGDGDDTTRLSTTLDAIVSSNGGNDTVNGGNGSDTIYGGPGNDALDGGVGVDTVYGGIGMDTVKGGPGVDWLYGDSASPEPTCTGSFSCTDSLYGGDQDDHLFGGEDADNLYGEDGADELREQKGDPVERNLLDGGYGNDVIFGGGLEMRDMVYYGTRPETEDISVNLAAISYGPIPAHHGVRYENGLLAEDDMIALVHDIGTGPGDDLLIGSDPGATLTSGTGNDTCGYQSGNTIKLVACSGE